MIFLTETEIPEPGVVISYLKGLLPHLIDFGIQVLIAAAIYLIGVKVIKLLRKIIRRGFDRTEIEEGAKQFLDSFIKFALYFLLIVIIGTKFGVTTASVVALLGSAGLAVGLALQGSLANFAGGVLILLLKPFLVGDYIITESGKEGTVAEVQIFYTKLTTVDNKVIVIPNGKLADGIVTNVSKMDKRRVDLTIGVTYKADLRKVLSLVRNLLEREETRLPEEELNVFVEELGESCVTIGARVWVRTEDYWTTKWRLTEELKYLMDEHGIAIPFPQLDVTITK